MEDVRQSAAWVASYATHVVINSSGIKKVVEDINWWIPKVECDFEGIRYFDNGPLSIQYLFVLNAINFCYWPDEEFSYDLLALGLKRALEHDRSAFNADRLQKYTGPELRQTLKWTRPLPLEDERIRLLHEVGRVLERNFNGKASKLVESCGKSAAKLVELITTNFPGFRDHTMYKGHQIFMYKRAQLLAADVWRGFKGQSYGELHDIGSLTIFADYIIPAVLRHLGVLNFTSSLVSTIDSNQEICSGSEQEVELRACAILAVEKIRELIEHKTQKQVSSVDLDVWLWSFGIQLGSLRHHRTLSTYY